MNFFKSKIYMKLDIKKNFTSPRKFSSFVDILTHNPPTIHINISINHANIVGGPVEYRQRLQENVRNEA